jgi:hypothetical protein
VAAVGDSFKISNYWPIGTPITIIFLASLLLASLRFKKISLKDCLVIFATVVIIIYGIYKNNIYYVLQDFLPIIISILLYLSLKSTGSKIIIEKISFYTRIFLIVATIKICYILISRPPPDWGSSWISSEYFIESGFPRIMLKGSSPLIFIAVVFELFNITKNKKWSFAYIVLGLTLIALDGSRALLAATIFPTLLVFIATLKLRANTIIFKTIPALGFLIIILAFVSGDLFRTSDSVVSGEFAKVGVESVSAAYRLLEIASALESVQNIYIGNGIGASFYAISSGAKSDNGEGIYIHSFPVWIYVKFGILGIIISTLLLIKFIYKLIIININRKFNSELLIINIFGVYFLSFISSSFVTNLLSTFTGSVAATLLAIIFFNEINKSSTIAKKQHKIL